VPNETAAKLNKWLLSGDTGSSSKCIAQHLTGAECSGDYPMDADDMGRCVGLLKAVPEFRARLPEMAKVNRYWAALIPRWSEIEGCQPDYKKCSSMIRSLTRPIEKDDPSVIRLNDNCSISFGGKRPA
jgi:hypothetical protein